MLSVAEALAAVVRGIPRLPTEHVAPATGRVIAEDIVASRALPGFDNSAMDGYAARSSELPATLAIAAVIGAGEMLASVPPGHCVRIFTGAPVPGELDTVVMQEDTQRDGDRVVLPASPAGENIRRRGEDIAIGERVFTAGTRLRSWDLGVLAALGVSSVAVATRPRVAIIATGSELVTVDTPPAHGQLVNSSAHALAALVTEAGGVPVPFGIVHDNLDDIRSALARASECDVVITTGGVSVGERDFVRAALDSLEIYKVAMKPGKPFTFGKKGNTPVFGLPGNPVSTLVGFELFVRPALLAMQRASVIERPRVTVTLPDGYRKQAGRAHYLRARIDHGLGGRIARVHPKQGSAMLSSLVGTNALVELPADLTEIAPDGTATAIVLEGA